MRKSPLLFLIASSLSFASVVHANSMSKSGELCLALHEIAEEQGQVVHLKNSPGSLKSGTAQRLSNNYQIFYKDFLTHARTRTMRQFERKIKACGIKSVELAASEMSAAEIASRLSKGEKDAVLKSLKKGRHTLESVTFDSSMAVGSVGTVLVFAGLAAGGEGIVGPIGVAMLAVGGAGQGGWLVAHSPEFARRAMLNIFDRPAVRQIEADARVLSQSKVKSLITRQPTPAIPEFRALSAEQKARDSTPAGLAR